MERKVTDDHSSLLAVSKALDRKLAGLKAVSAQLDLLSSESIRSYDPNTKRLINLNSQAESISQLFHQLTQLQSKRQDLIKPYTFSTSNQHPLDSVTLPVTVKYEHLINDLAMSKVDDLVAELGEKAGADTEVDENLTEVMNHLALKGKSNVCVFTFLVYILHPWHQIDHVFHHSNSDVERVSYYPDCSISLFFISKFHGVYQQSDLHLDTVEFIRFSLVLLSR